MNLNYAEHDLNRAHRLLTLDDIQSRMLAALIFDRIRTSLMVGEWPAEEVERLSALLPARYALPRKNNA